MSQHSRQRGCVSRHHTGVLRYRCLRCQDTHTLLLRIRVPASPETSRGIWIHWGFSPAMLHANRSHVYHICITRASAIAPVSHMCTLTYLMSMHNSSTVVCITIRPRYCIDIDRYCVRAFACTQYRKYRTHIMGVQRVYHILLRINHGRIMCTWTHVRYDCDT